jgi:hypothetical protein
LTVEDQLETGDTANITRGILAGGINVNTICSNRLHHGLLEIGGAGKGKTLAFAEMSKVSLLLVSCCQLLLVMVIEGKLGVYPITQLQNGIGIIGDMVGVHLYCKVRGNLVSLSLGEQNGLGFVSFTAYCIRCCP